MSNILALESATESCSVALLRSDGSVFEQTEVKPMIHAQKLFDFVEDCLAQASLSFKDLNAVAVSAGPGSYTGLRIGVSAAKGYCYGLDIPLIGINTLKALALQMQTKAPSSANVVLIPMIDRFDAALNEIESTQATIFAEDTFAAYSQKQVYIAGNGAAKAKTFFEHLPNVHLLENIHCTARTLLELAQKKYQVQDFEQTDLFEPFYLKDFIAGKPKKLF
jgi:tRNA threonylcarbamoyladenosine biosynthesis protein TsaB